MLATILLKSFWWKLVVCLVCGYLALCLLVYFGQRRLLYFPSKSQLPLPEGFTAWRSPDQTEQWGWKRIQGSKQALLFFHGNGGNASGWSHAVTEFPGDIYVLEYPGYGQRPGTPSESSLKKAAVQAFEQTHPAYEQIILAGQSLGSGVTQALFTKHPDRIHALVLITPFTSIAAVARHHYAWLPTSWLLRDTYPLFEELKQFPGKAFLVLAGRDEIIPPAQNRQFLECKSERCQVINAEGAGHNEIELDRTFWKKTLEP